MDRLPKLVRRQMDVVYLDPSGHTVVLGTAGSGKTSMAIYRAMYLQKQFTNPGERTLLATFNRMLVSYMDSLGGALPSGLRMEHYHKTARGYLNKRGKMGRNSILDSDCSWKATDRKRLVEQAVMDIRQQTSASILQRPVSFFVEEFKWIAQFGIRSLPEYIRIERVGRRSSRAARASRPAVWQVYKRYRELREHRGYSYDWDDMAVTLEDELKTDNFDWMYRHIVVDEGQDFSPSMLRSLAAAIPNNGSLSLFGDVAQQIYGIRVSWKDAGLNTQKIVRFKENYRNTPEIADLALAISDMPYFSDEPDIVRPTSRQAAGPLPTLVKCGSLAREQALTRDLAARLGGTQRVGVFLRKRDQVRNLIARLHKKHPDLSVTELHPERGYWQWDPGVMVGTYQSAKGLEFDAVIMPTCDTGHWPDADRTNEVGRDEACAEDARLLYVGVTRARQRVIISFSGKLTELLPDDMSLYNLQEV